MFSTWILKSASPIKVTQSLAQSLAQVTCPGYKAEQSQELLKASGLSLLFIQGSFAITSCIPGSVWRKGGPFTQY